MVGAGGLVEFLDVVEEFGELGVDFGVLGGGLGDDGGGGGGGGGLGVESFEEALDRRLEALGVESFEEVLEHQLEPLGDVVPAFPAVCRGGL